MKLATLICIECNKEYQIYKSTLKIISSHYCSWDCRYMSKRLNVICLNCKIEFSIIKARGTAKYCSRACGKAHRNLIRKCDFCNQKFHVSLSDTIRGNGRFCSQSCSTKYRIYISKDFQRKNISYSFYERFFFYISHENHKNNCWEWIGNKNKAGYGRLIVNYKDKTAHRISWELHCGEVPKNRWVLHKCDNPSCVNPDHLFTGTPKDNADDRSKKGRNRNQNGSNHNFAKLLEFQVLNIRERLAKGEKGNALAKEYNVHVVTISNIKTRKKWNHI